MAIKYNEQDKSYSRLNDKGKLLGTVTQNDSLGRYSGIAAEYAAQQQSAAKAKEPSGYDKYKAAAEQYNNALKEAKTQQTEAQVAAMGQQLAAAKQQTEDANAEAYAAKRISEKNIGQQLAAAGLGNGGASETARLQNELNWQNTVNSNNQQLMNAEQSIQNQINQYRANAAAENAQLDYDLASELNQMFWEQEQQDKADELTREQWAYQKERDSLSDKLTAEENQRSLALTLLNMGYNNEQIAKALGLSTSEIAQRLAGNVKSSGGTSGSSTKSAKSAKSTATNSDSSGSQMTDKEKQAALALQMMKAGLLAGSLVTTPDFLNKNVTGQGGRNMTVEEAEQAYMDDKISLDELAAVYSANGITLK